MCFPFPMDPQKGKKISKILCAIPPDGVSHLGEIIISYPEAIVQARNKEHDIRSELLILIIHGVLHLLGYDHEQSKEKEQHMKTREEEILKKLTLMIAIYYKCSIVLSFLDLHGIFQQ